MARFSVYVLRVTSATEPLKVGPGTGQVKLGRPREKRVAGPAPKSQRQGIRRSIQLIRVRSL